jgi:ABC-2 type transport system ATP-binding protein
MSPHLDREGLPDRQRGGNGRGDGRGFAARAFRNYLQVRAGRLRDLAACRRRDAFSERYGRGCRKLDDLVSSGLIAELPKDPLGFGFGLDASGWPILNSTLRSGQMSVPAIAIEGLEKHYPRKWRSAPVRRSRRRVAKRRARRGLRLHWRERRRQDDDDQDPDGADSGHGASASLSGLPSGSDARLGLGYVPENPYLYDYLTPLEILGDGHAPASAQGQCPKAHCMAWLERLGLEQVASKAIRSFSKGMTQRVAIAQALCIKPRLLILDEPLSGLDPIGRRDVVDILSEYKRGGGTLFLTSHVLHDVERLADRFGLIHKGVLRAVRAPAELTGDQETVMVRTFGQVAVDGMREDFSGRWIGEVPRGDLWNAPRSPASCRACGAGSAPEPVAGGGVHARRRRVVTGACVRPSHAGVGLLPGRYSVSSQRRAARENEQFPQEAAAGRATRLAWTPSVLR